MNSNLLMQLSNVHQCFVVRCISLTNHSPVVGFNSEVNEFNIYSVVAKVELSVRANI